MPGENPTRVERAAENALFKLAARASMVLAFPMVAWFGGEMWTMARKASDAIIEIRGDIRGLSNQFTARVDGHEGRIAGIERRNDMQDDKIESLQKRVYQMGGGYSTPSPRPEEQQRKQWQKK